MTFKTRLIAGFGVALALLICVGALSYWSVVQNANERQWMNHTHLVLEKLDSLSTNLIDAETGERGYLLTGEESYLAPYNGAAGRVHENSRDLRELTADNPIQQRALDRLGAVIESRLALLQHGIEIRRQGGLAAGADFTAGGSGKRLMDEARMEIAAMRLEEDHLLAQRSLGVERTSSRTRVVIVSGNALGFLLLLLAGVVVQREMGRRKDAEDKIRSLNVDLERRVDERTAELAERMKDLARSNSELQRFAVERERADQQIRRLNEELEERVRRRTAELEAANSELEAFSYSVSHDLRAPLRHVDGFSRILIESQGNKMNEEGRRYLREILDATQQMAGMIEDLLRLAQIGRQQLRLQKTNIKDLIDDVLADLKSEVCQRRIEWKVGALPSLECDRGLIKQVFTNLVGNAVKYTRSRDVAVIEIGQKMAAEEQPVIFVRDNGAGFETKYADKLFGAFQRLHRQEEFEGTGVGLATVQRIIRRHGGRIWAEAEPQKGATFYFTLA